MSTTMRIRDVASVERLAEPASSDRSWLLNLDVIEKDTGRIREKVYVESGRLCGSIVPFSKASVLYSKLRPNLNKVVLPDEDGFATTELLPLKVNSSFIRREYLAVYLRSQRFVSYAVNAVAGAKMPRISRTAVLDAPIPIPDLAMQDEIVSELNAVCGNLQSLTDLSDVLDELVKSRFIEMFGDPIENPFGWDTKPLGELGELKNGVNFKSVDSGTEIRCLGVGDFKDRYQISDMDLISIVSLNGKPNESQMLRDGDIVFVRSNGNKQLVGRCLAVFPGDEEVTFSGFCIRFRNESDGLLLDYLLGCLKSDSMRKAMTGRGANIQNLSQKILSGVVMPMPPIALQQEFAAFVQKVDKLKFETQQAIGKLQMLYDSLAQEYFGS